MTIKEMVYGYPTQYETGFILKEIHYLKAVCKKIYPNFSDKKFEDALTGNTCMMKDGNIITYHCDLLTALKCGAENRDMTQTEFD